MMTWFIFYLTSCKFTTLFSIWDIFLLFCASKIVTDGSALMSYSRHFQIASMAQRKVHDPIFVRDGHGSSCSSSTKSQRTSKNLARDAGSQIYWFSRLQELVGKHGDIILTSEILNLENVGQHHGV